MDITYHYPPELMSLLIDTIPLLHRSKRDVLIFFKGAGISNQLLSDLSKQVDTDREKISKYEIVRTVLIRLNEKGEITLRERREILKRVIEYETFATCWPADQLKAQGLVAKIQRVVNVKDSFTRMKDEREKELQKQQAKHLIKIKETEQKQKELLEVKNDLFALFGMSDTKRRGKKLEGILNRLFKLYGIAVQEAFEVVGDNNEGIIEQIDGAIQLDSSLYLVEMKWWKEKLGLAEISPHIVKIYNRPETHGIFISTSGYTESAIIECKTVLSQGRIMILCELEEIVILLDKEKELDKFLRDKIQVAKTHKNPFFKPLEYA